MDVFKLKTGIQPVYKISKDIFETITKKEYPYYQIKDNHQSCYAVCPECDNPIQIIGLHKKNVESGGKTFGRHHVHSIKNLASYSEIDYDNCPFSNPNRTKNSQLRAVKSKVSKRILETLKQHFDQVIAILNDQTNMHISLNLAEKMLDSYLACEGWRYRDASLYNLPWTFAECSPALPLFGRLILNNSPLYRAIESKCPEVEFVHNYSLADYKRVQQHDRQYVNLDFVFLNHQKEIVEETLKESIDFLVIRPNEDNRIIFSKTIRIDSYSFSQCIFSDDKITKDEEQSKHLLEMAAQKINQYL